MEQNRVITENLYSELENVRTPEIADFSGFMDADEELRPIASYIKRYTQHNSEIEPSRIKFLYHDKPRKEGGRYVCGDLVIRKDYEKMINDTFDYFVMIYYPAWKRLDIQNKVIQLDKILCGVDLGDEKRPKIGVKQKDSREYIENMNHFGPTSVMRSSEAVHLAVESIVEELKESKRSIK